jgi:hypothetical protein
MSTQVGIGKSIHRNPEIAASEAVEMAVKTGAIEKADLYSCSLPLDTIRKR